MLDGETLTTLAGIAVVAFAAGFVHSAIGFGFGIVALSVMPFLLDIKAAHVVISLSSVPMLIMAAWAYREGIQWPSLRLSMLGALLFLPPGLWAFLHAPLDLLVRGTGVAILAMVLLSLRKTADAKQESTSKLSCFAAGAASGFLAGAVSIAGPPVAAFALKQDWSQAQFKAFVTQCLLVIACYKAVVMFLDDELVTGEMVTQSLLAAPFAIVGVQLGAWASRYIKGQRFKRIVAASLVLVSCIMIFNGAS